MQLVFLFVSFLLLTIELHTVSRKYHKLLKIGPMMKCRKRSGEGYIVAKRIEYKNIEVIVTFKVLVCTVYSLKYCS